MQAFQKDVEIMSDRFYPLTQTEEEWHVLVSIILETYHIACYGITGVKDNREDLNQMPWERPIGKLCESRSLL
jgi:hypothetical protein